MQRARWLHLGFALTGFPSIILVTKTISAPDKFGLWSLMKLTYDYEHRTHLELRKENLAAESILRRRLGSFLIRAWVACTTTATSDLKSAVPKRLQFLALWARLSMLHRVGSILDLAPSTILRAGGTVYNRCRFSKVRTAKSYGSGIQQAGWISNHALNANGA